MPVLQAVVEPLDLVGTWSLRRRLHDRRTGTFGSATGTLTITGAGDWLESGRLQFAGFDGPFERRLLIRTVAGEWWVTFGDGRPFHPWQPGAVVQHQCRADQYRGLIAVDPLRGRLRTWWDVTGPTKSQRLVTDFRREDRS